MNRTSLENLRAEERRVVTDPDLLDSLAGLHAEADMAVVQRTRRAVMEASQQMRGRQVRGRRQLGIILLAFGALLILLTPAIWTFADDLFGDEHFMDLPAMTMSLIVTFVSGIFAALLVSWRSRQSRDGERL